MKRIIYGEGFRCNDYTHFYLLGEDNNWYKTFPYLTSKEVFKKSSLNSAQSDPININKFRRKFRRIKRKFGEVRIVGCPKYVGQAWIEFTI